MAKNKILLLLVGIIVLGSFLRFYKLGETSFVADEFLDINASYGYFKTGEWQAWDFNLEKPAERINIASDERAWLYRIQPAFLFQFLPPTEAVARAASVFWGLLSIVIIYFTAAYFSRSQAVGLLAALLLALSIDGIEFSRKMRMYAMFFPVYLVFSWTVFKFLEEDYAGKNRYLSKVKSVLGLNFIYLVPVVILGALSFHLHQLSVNIIPVIGIYLLISAFLTIKKENKYFNKYSLLLFSALLILVAMLSFAPDKISYFTAGLKIFNNHYSYLEKIFSDYSHWLLAFLFSTGGFYYLSRSKNLKKEAGWLGLSVMIPLLGAIFLWRRNPGIQYIFFVKSFLIILMATGIWGFLEYLKKNLADFGKKRYVAVLVLIFLVLSDHSYFFQKDNTYRQTSQSENPNYRKVFGYVKKHREKGDVMITRNFRNYYLSGAKIPVMNYGGELAEEKLSLEEVSRIMKENSSGWAVIAENDERYISREARDYLEKNAVKINALETRGKISVYHWPEKK